MTHRIDLARPEDIPALRGLILELAEFEQLTHLVVCTEADLNAALFGPAPSCEAVLLRTAQDCMPEMDVAPLAFALYFHNFSTFLGKRGLYLEDLYVQPAGRNQGFGRALLIHLAGIAQARGCGRFEWSVLDWNVNAQRFYQSLGASILPDWRLARVTGTVLQQMAELPPA